MNFNFENIEEVKKEAIAFRKNYPVQLIQEDDKPYSYTVSKDMIEKWKGCFSTHNGVIAFFDEDAMYVIPNMSNAYDIVKKACKDDDIEEEGRFDFPLSKGERLCWKVLQEHWEFLKVLQRQQWEW